MTRVSSASIQWRRLSFFRAVILAATPIWVAAAQSNTPTEDIASLDSKALSVQLASVLNSEAIIIGDATTDQKATELMLQLFGTQEEMKTIEADYPGIGKELADAILPIVNRYMRQRLPQLQAQQAQLYADNFSAAELKTLIDFYTSPTGQKMIASMTSRIQPKAMMQEASQSEDFQFSAGAALKDIRDTVPGILSDLGEEDRETLVQFARSGVLPKLQALGPKTQAIAISWNQQYAENEEREIEQIVESIFARRAEKDGK